MLETKIWYMEEGVNPWVKTKFQDQNRQDQGRLDAFEQRMTRQLGSGQILYIAEVKIQVSKIKKIVDDLDDKPFIPATVIIEIKPKIEVKNIQSISKPEKEKIKERRKRKHQSTEKEAFKK